MFATAVKFVRGDDFRRANLLDPCTQIAAADFAGGQFAVRHIQPRQPQRTLAAMMVMAFAVGGLDTQQIRVGLLGQQRRVGHGAGREDARDFALNRAFARGGIADLFANRDRFAQLQQFWPNTARRRGRARPPGDRLAIGRAAQSV